MFVIQALNVNDAYRQSVLLLLEHGVREETRAGKALVMPAPVVTVTKRPWQRVLFDETRDANPFFHLFEALWMLAGRRDSKFLDRFVGDFGSRYAEEDGTLHGAYGFRWRRHFDIEGGGFCVDQLEECIDILRTDPSDRRIVLSMWDPVADLGADRRDVPCNTHVYFRIVDGALETTVLCRSNDAVWGAHGANAVHFSLLHEYVAEHVGVQMGHMYQWSNNYHAYEDVILRVGSPIFNNIYDLEIMTHHSLGKISRSLIADFLHSLEGGWRHISNNDFLMNVAQPMFEAHLMWKNRNFEDAMKCVEHIAAEDWRLACRRWLERRINK